MSSFFVSDETINNIVTGLTASGWTDCLMWDYPFKDYIKKDEDFNRLGRKLIRLNLKALKERYGDKETKKINYKFEFKESSLIQFYKNLQFFTYQCSEGKVIEEKLFKDLMNIEKALASKIVSDLKEYNKASWGH